MALHVALAPCATEAGLHVAAPPALGCAVAVMACAAANRRGALHWAVVPVLLPVQFQSKADAVLVIVLGIAAWQGAIGSQLWFGMVKLGPWQFHPLVLMFALSGTLMISKTVRIPKP